MEIHTLGTPTDITIGRRKRKGRSQLTKDTTNRKGKSQLTKDTTTRTIKG
jgi:hypothetical protein